MYLPTHYYSKYEGLDLPGTINDRSHFYREIDYVSPSRRIVKSPKKRVVVKKSPQGYKKVYEVTDRPGPYDDVNYSVRYYGSGNRRYGDAPGVIPTAPPLVRSPLRGQRLAGRPKNSRLNRSYTEYEETDLPGTINDKSHYYHEEVYTTPNKVTVQDVKRFVNGKPEAYVVVFADWCGHCQNMKREMMNAGLWRNSDKLLLVEEKQAPPSMKDHFPHVHCYVNGREVGEITSTELMDRL